MFSLEKIENLENSSISSFRGYIPRMSNKEYLIDLGKEKYKKLCNERSTLKKELERSNSRFEKQLKMDKINRVDMKIIELNKYRAELVNLNDGKVAPLDVDNSKYFNKTIQFAMISIVEDGNLSTSVVKIKEEMLDHVMRDYMETVYDTLIENKNSPRVRQNLSDVVDFFFSPSGKGYYLMDNYNYAREVNSKNQRTSVNWFNLLQCCANPDFTFKGSKIEKFYENEVKRIKNLLNENSKNKS